MSQEVLEGQQWLNKTYGHISTYCYVDETGLPGTAMSQALVSAFQIDIGMSTVTGVFGDMTAEQLNWINGYDDKRLELGRNSNRIKIIQYGLYSKGYNPGSASGTYDTATGIALQEIIADAGVSVESNPVVNPMIAKAVLGVDEYKLVGDGDVKIRSIQQDLNQRYRDYFGLCACDGHYGRSTNQALIYAIQVEEGLSVDDATGFIGNTTKAYLPDLWQSGQYGLNGTYTASQIANFTILAKYALYCIGRSPYKTWAGSGSDYDPGSFNGSQSETMLSALHSFQSDTGLTVRNMVGLNEWMGLLVSTGNPNRDALACDCATQLTSASLAQSIYNEDYRVVGRYLTGSVGSGASESPKNLTSGEIQTIFDAGLNLFCIYQDDKFWWQDHDDLSGYFGHNRGYSDAWKAVTAAESLGIPKGEYIYFAVDYDFMEDEVYEKVVPHFQGINACMASFGNPYKIGIYSARNTCGIVSAQGLAASSFVSDMSTGYSGNLGYPLPSNWAFDQIKEYTNPAGVPIDKDVTSGRYMGFNYVEATTLSYERPAIPSPSSSNKDMSEVIGKIYDLENLYSSYFSLNHPDIALDGKTAAKGVLSYLRSYGYNDTKWLGTLLDPVDETFMSLVRADETLYGYFDPIICDGERVSVADWSTSPAGVLDLAHFAATAEAYIVQNPIIPDYWAGWGGDLATGMRDVSNRSKSSGYAGMSIEEIAMVTIGAEVGAHASSCNYSDFCSDIDAYVIGKKLLAVTGTNHHALSETMTWYYSSMSAQRFEQFIEAIDEGANLSNLASKTLARMKQGRVGDAFTVIGLLGKDVEGEAPSDAVVSACCESLANYIGSMI